MTEKYSDLKAAIKASLSDFIDFNKISGLHIDEDHNVMFSIVIDPSMSTAMEDLRQKAERSVASIDGVQSARAILTAETKPAQKSTPDPHGMNKNPKLTLPFRNIIAVASGKGGVGKSTIAAGLSRTLSRQGHKVALLDCDIYGPNIPHLMNLPLKKPEQTSNGLTPFESEGIKVMSIGFLAPENAAMIWRGPMVQIAIYQMLRDTNWSADGETLDYLILDMPPGTGDAQLTIAQKIDVTGAIIVSTPQDLSLEDARKAIAMFEKTEVPVLGLIENMSMFICENCGHENYIFDHLTVEAEAQKFNIPFLGALPLSRDIQKPQWQLSNEMVETLLNAIKN
ncbi:MAG: P-loop NTPase [Pseudomonadota bacterium]